MKRWLPSLLVLVLTLVVSAVAMPRAHACSCMYASTPAAAKARADVVLGGEVTAVRDAGEDQAITMRVDRVYKGAAHRTAYVRTAAQTTACGAPMREGQKALVFGRGEGVVIETSWCDGTRRLRADRPQTWQAELGPGAAPRAGSPGDPPPEWKGGLAGTLAWFDRTGAWPVAVAALFTVALAVVLTLRRRRDDHNAH
ncbi:hypothetical protein [Luteipulveratus halotolerans]|uniref:Tissue inhibitor of metalloproteinase n=1 Tax=Luteipulveratus halotolerans TaxID=1631356 RepID=A0A0L6CLL7_9MICO|nr:hypothetical protein [Luteipulveratus halotolerans]KNX38624.1 hypothetical protein VV01_18130 [Luteipulveratus halotolerans]